MKRVFTARKVKRSSGLEDEFDRDFWRKMGHEKRFAAAWEMVNEVALVRGEKDAGQPRLQRSIQTIKRRSGRVLI
jgi:hypothetical protein